MWMYFYIVMIVFLSVENSQGEDQSNLSFDQINDKVMLWKFYSFALI